MAILEQYKIKESEVATVDVKSAPDILNSDTTTNKDIFDKFPQLITDKFNAFVDYVAQEDTSEIEPYVVAKFREWGMPDR